MMLAVRGYLLSLCAAALLTTLVLALLPKGSVRKLASLCCGLLMAVVTISPLVKLDTASIAQAITKLEMQAETARTGVEVQNKELVNAIIKEKTQTYILDKAASMGQSLEVEVKMYDGDGDPYPESVRIVGKLSAEQRAVLQQYIEENLAIAQDRQEWSSP